MLKIIDGGEMKLETIVCVVYGIPGIGKTTFGLTARKPLLLDFDGNSVKASNRAGKAIVQVRRWNDIEDLDGPRAAAYGTVVVDTVGTALDILGEAVGDSNPKLRNLDGGLSLKGFGALKTRFRLWLGKLHRLGLDVVLIAHNEEREKDSETVDRIVATGGSKLEIYRQAHIMGRMSAGRKGERMLSFEPSAGSYAKNAGLPDYAVGDPAVGQSVTLEEIVEQAKTNINAQNVAHEAESRRFAEYSRRIEEAATADALSAVLADAESRKDKVFVWRRSKVLGVEWDAKVERFVHPDPQAPEEAPEAVPEEASEKPPEKVAEKAPEPPPDEPPEAVEYAVADSFDGPETDRLPF